MGKTREERRAIATAFVSEVNARTVCAVCGKQPIEWHGEHHPEKPNARISSLRAQGISIERIQAEMDICTPLCRSHHMSIDGRAAALFANQPRQPGSVITQPLPCSCCSKPTKPMRKGMCSTCYNHHKGIRIRKTNSCDGCCLK